MGIVMGGCWWADVIAGAGGQFVRFPAPTLFGNLVPSFHMHEEPLVKGLALQMIAVFSCSWPVE